MRGEERRSDREDVRLSPGSFLQLLPAEVLMSRAGSECRIEDEEKHRFLYCHIFYDTPKGAGLVTGRPLKKRTV